MNASAQATGAAVANVNLLKGGNVDVIFVQNDIASYAYNGTEMFKDQAYKDLRGMVSLYNETVQLVALESSGIKSVADLKGKKVSVGAAGSGTEANARQILEAAGLTYNDIKVQYLSSLSLRVTLKMAHRCSLQYRGHPDCSGPRPCCIKENGACADRRPSCC